MDWETILLTVLIVVLVLALIAVIAWYFSLRRKKKLQPSHVDLYFGENFRRIMNEWDMTTRDKVKSFKKDMSGRLSKVGKEIDGLERNKMSLEKRLGKLDKEMENMEKF
jgi:ABC-type branched-subunit amino acid transport system permease subunit